jgi:hypothetical protein
MLTGAMGLSVGRLMAKKRSRLLAVITSAVTTPDFFKNYGTYSHGSPHLYFYSS